MTKLLLAAVIAALLATSPAHAEDTSFKISYEPSVLAYAASAESAETAYDTSARTLSTEVQESTTRISKVDSPSSFARVVEIIIASIGNVVSSPMAGTAFALTR
jgi:hypothetical protein